MTSQLNHFVAIGQFKLELQSGNAKFGSESAIFWPAWPWNLTDDLKKNNRAPLLYDFKLGASFRSHLWIQTGVTARKGPIQIKIDNFFCPAWPWNLTDDPEKQLDTSLLCYFKLCESFRSHWSIQTDFCSWAPRLLHKGDSPCTLVVKTYQWLHRLHFGNTSFLH